MDKVENHGEFLHQHQKEFATGLVSGKERNASRPITLLVEVVIDLESATQDEF
ncbi:MAG: hypothetical protein AAGF83_19695 [Cyanobacteria bacterium P01_G01_bin.67]